MHLCTFIHTYMYSHAFLHTYSHTFAYTYMLSSCIIIYMYYTKKKTLVACASTREIIMVSTWRRYRLEKEEIRNVIDESRCIYAHSESSRISHERRTKYYFEYESSSVYIPHIFGSLLRFWHL